VLQDFFHRQYGSLNKASVFFCFVYCLWWSKYPWNLIVFGTVCFLVPFLPTDSLETRFFFGYFGKHLKSWSRNRLVYIAWNLDIKKGHPSIFFQKICRIFCMGCKCTVYLYDVVYWSLLILGKMVQRYLSPSVSLCNSSFYHLTLWTLTGKEDCKLREGIVGCLPGVWRRLTPYSALIFHMGIS